DQEQRPCRAHHLHRGRRALRPPQEGQEARPPRHLGDPHLPAALAPHQHRRRAGVPGPDRAPPQRRLPGIGFPRRRLAPRAAHRRGQARSRPGRHRRSEGGVAAQAGARHVRGLRVGRSVRVRLERPGGARLRRRGAPPARRARAVHAPHVRRPREREGRPPLRRRARCVLPRARAEDAALMRAPAPIILLLASVAAAASEPPALRVLLAKDGQVTMTPKVKVGEPFTMPIPVTPRPGVSVSMPASFSLAPFEVISKREVPAAQGERAFELGVVAWEPGELKLPAIAIPTFAGGETGEVRTDELAVTVEPTIVDESAEPRPIAGPVAGRGRDLTLVWAAGGALSAA